MKGERFSALALTLQQFTDRPNNDKQNKGLFVFDTVFITTIIWLALSGSPDNGPDKDSIDNKMPLFYIYLSTEDEMSKTYLSICTNMKRFIFFLYRSYFTDLQMK